MLSKFSVYKYVKTAKGWRYARAAYAKNNKLRPDVVVISGQEERHTEGSYYLLNDGKWIHAGKTAVEAQEARDKAIADYNRNRAYGMNEPAHPVQKSTPLAVAVEKYFRKLEGDGKDGKTVRAYRCAVDQFVAQCRKQFVEQIEADDMTDFKLWLRQQPVPQRVHGNPERTMFNKLGHVAIWLKSVGKGGLLHKNDYPQFTPKVVRKHTDEELTKLYFNANDDERFLLDFFLGTGFREGEAAHAEYEDLSDRVITVQRKPRWNWHPKRNKARSVPLTQALADAIRARGTTGLIFPDQNGKPDGHLLRRLQRLAKRCGIFSELHMLRKTWATRLANSGTPLQDLKEWLGHEKLDTTQKYLATASLTSAQTSSVVEAAAFVPPRRETEATCTVQ